MRARAPLHIALIALVIAASCVAAGCEDRRTPTEQAAEWWPPSERATARCIIHLESGNDPAVTGGAGEAGLLQIHPVHAADFRRLTGRPFHPAAWDPVLNGQYGYHLWREQGWRPWSTHRRCGV